jgi:membrane protease YdiL (CAAX protease family)
MDYRLRTPKALQGMDNKVRTLVLPIVLPTTYIFIAEGFLFFHQVEASAAVHCVNILICILLPILLGENPFLWQAFSLVSILRILNIGMPRFDPITLHWILLIYAPVIVVAFLMIKDENRKVTSYLKDLKMVLSPRSNVIGWKYYYMPLGVIIALILANFEFKVLGSIKLVPDLGLASLTLLLVAMVFFVGVGEELVFRYILQNRLQTSLGVLGAIILSSLIFAAMHSGYSSIQYATYVFFVSLLLGGLFYKTKSLAFVALIHGSLNFFLFSFLPYGHLLLF